MVAHTVLSAPTRHQRPCSSRSCGARRCRRGDDRRPPATGCSRGFDVDAAKVDSDPPRRDHAPCRPTRRDPHRRRSPSARVLTWGLLGPGKGIEWAIDAMAQLVGPAAPPELPRRRRDPSQGAAQRDGEPYRQMLVERACEHAASRSQVSLRRRVPRPRGADAADPLRRRGRAALRLRRSGHVGRARRRRRRRADPWSRPPSRTPSSCSPAAPASSCRNATRTRWPARSAPC